MRRLSIKWKIGLAVALLLLIGLSLWAALLVGLRRSVGTYYIPSHAMAPTLQVNDHILTNNLAYGSSEPKRGDVVVFRAPPAASPDGQERLFIKRVIAVPGDTVRITPGYVLAGGEEYCHFAIKSALGVKPDECFVRFTADGVVLNGNPMSNQKLATALGLPKGTKIVVHPGVVYLNDKALSEPYTAEDCDTPYPMPNTNREWIITKRVGKENVQCVRIPEGKLLLMGDNRNDSNDCRFWGLLDRDRVQGRAVSITFPSDRAGPIR